MYAEKRVRLNFIQDVLHSSTHYSFLARIVLLILIEGISCLQGRLQPVSNMFPQQ